MFFITMIKGIGADTEGQYYHPHFKTRIVNNIDTK